MKPKPKKPDPRLWQLYKSTVGPLVAVRDGDAKLAAKIAMEYSRVLLSEFRRMTGERK